MGKEVMSILKAFVFLSCIHILDANGVAYHIWSGSKSTLVHEDEVPDKGPSNKFHQSRSIEEPQGHQHDLERLVQLIDPIENAFKHVVDDKLLVIRRIFSRGILAHHQRESEVNMIESTRNKQEQVLHPSLSATSPTINVGTVFPHLSKWNGAEITQDERMAVAILRSKIVNMCKERGSSCSMKWLQTCTDVDILRFYRSLRMLPQSHRVDEAFKSIVRHAQWRVGPEGADTVMTKYSSSFEKSQMNCEMFWLGVNKEGSPTLVVRTQAHDLKHYNGDPKVFNRYVELYF